MTIIDDLLRHARDRPHAPAGLDPSRSLSWEDLRDEVTAVAAGMRARGVRPSDRVGLHLGNSLDFLVAALAANWCGGTFVALDPAGPPARTASLVGDFEPTLLVPSDRADREAAGLSPACVTTVRELAGAGQARVPRADPDAPAYIVYTSGTSGAPKGVTIGHPALGSALAATAEAVELDTATRAVCVSPFHFDGSYATLFATVHAGGLVTIPERERLLFPRNFARWVEDHAVDVAGFTPTYLRLLMAGRALPRISAGPLRLVAIGGEALPASDVLELLAAAPHLRVFNRYGPTETTIAVAHHRLLAEQIHPGEPVPVGRPHPGSSFHVLDEHLQPVPVGLPGELWIGGAQLMDGYWQAPELTASVLRSDIGGGGRGGETLYRSGDLVRAGADGVVTWLDRLDRVVKRRGVRISLAEVSAALRAVGPAGAGIALARESLPDKEIVGFVVADRSSLPGLRAALAERLPLGMLPDRLVAVDSLPLGSGGKLDEHQLTRLLDNFHSNTSGPR